MSYLVAGFHQLIDSVNGRAIIAVQETSNGWKWERKTNFHLQRALAVSGTADTLVRTKIASIQGLPFEA